MQTTVPPIYTWRGGPARLGWIGRLTAAATSLGCFVVLIIASRVSPSPAGVGTHQALGLAPCNFEQRSGVPCPTCGMTTSFAYFARGQLAASAYVQPMGAVLAFTSAIVFWAGSYIALTGRPVHRLLRWVPARYAVAPWVVLAILAWIWKIWIHLRGMDGWRA